MRRIALLVGIACCAVSIVALTVGLLYLGSSLFLGLVLIALGVASMEGGAHLVRHAGDPDVFSLKSPFMSGLLAAAALAIGILSGAEGARFTPIDEPLWLRWSLFVISGLCGWVGLRAGWHAISASRTRGAA